jgi:hypothetical protein
MSKEVVKKLIEDLKRRKDFHYESQNDPHNVSKAVYVALAEVIEALEAANE